MSLSALLVPLDLFDLPVPFLVLLVVVIPFLASAGAQPPMVLLAIEHRTLPFPQHPGRPAKAQAYAPVSILREAAVLSALLVLPMPVAAVRAVPVPLEASIT